MEEQIYDLGQKIYLTLNGVYNDVTGDERDLFVNETIDWTNQYLEELSLEADWSYLRTQGATLGTVLTTTTVSALPATIMRPVYDWQRPVVMTKLDGQKVVWHLVKPNLLYNASEGGIQQNRVALVGRTLKFSRPFTADEVGATIAGDVISKFTPISLSSTASLDLIQPQQLIVLGVAKNQVLPDVVNNTLTANYDVKYQRLLRKAIELDGASTGLDVLETDDLSFVGGVY
jgi:hypothetical protein